MTGLLALSDGADRSDGGAGSDGAGAPGDRVLRLWRRLDGVPLGRSMFALVLARIVPYSSTTGARVVHLEPGRCRVRLRDRRKVRNHLRSIHAVALTNVGELAGGLAMLTALPPDVRGIVVRLDTSYTKKARGTVYATCECSVPEVRREEDVEHTVTAVLVDESDDEVARVRATWRLRPPP